jgi:signal transduction histidine kinase
MHLIVDPLLSRLDSTTETACFRVVQEALTNIARHAQARNVWVELRQYKNAVVITVSDDGVGFNVQEARERAIRGACRGVLGMEERVRLAGGLFEIHAGPQQRTTVRARFPITQIKLPRPFTFEQVLPIEEEARLESK